MRYTESIICRVGYVALLTTSADMAVDALTEKTANNKDMYYRIAGFIDKYSMEPETRQLDEDTYDHILGRMESSPWLEDYECAIPRSQRQRLAMNRPGTLAADFAYETPTGKRSLLSAIYAEYTLVYFYNPGCDGCSGVRGIMEYSPVITAMQSEGTLKILAMYPEDDMAVWKEHQANMPAGWINARDPRGVVRTRLYDIHTMPSLYLLDKDKTVILRDASLDKIEQHLLAGASPEADNSAII